MILRSPIETTTYLWGMKGYFVWLDLKSLLKNLVGY